ncbi:MAG TPA: hypothetical protein VNK52_10885 [Hyphomicrobiaceae bacterium]|nr:hypothetical protein [Hyphomicrobiaceae bacterium]
MPFIRQLAAFALAALIPVADPASAASPFAPLVGSWSGDGTVLFEGGQSERLRCNARYTSAGNSRLDLNLRCASTSGAFHLTGRLTDRGGRVTGEWSEHSFGAEGTAFGRASGDSIVLRLSGSVAGAMSVSTSGSRQSVSVSTQGTALRNIRITLRRR